MLAYLFIGAMVVVATPILEVEDQGASPVVVPMFLSSQCGSPTVPRGHPWLTGFD